MVGGRVVLKFGGREKIQPAVGVVGAQDTKISFNLLIGSFCLSIGLRMEGSGELDVIFEKLCQFSGES